MGSGAEQNHPHVLVHPDGNALGSPGFRLQSVYG
jgi:hypothetical protein